MLPVALVFKTGPLHVRRSALLKAQALQSMMLNVHLEIDLWAVCHV